MESEKFKTEETEVISCAQQSMEEARLILSTPINPSNEDVLISSLNTIKVILFSLYSHSFYFGIYNKTKNNFMINI